MKIFDSKERKLLWLFVLLGFFGAAFFIFNYKLVSPSASLNFQVSRPQAREQAEAFLKGLKLDPAGYSCGITFQSDDDEAVFVEKTLGTEQANRFFQTELAPWYWKIRWYRPLQEEEMAVAVSPNGKVIGYRHHVPEDYGSGFLQKETGLQIATDFIENKLGIRLKPWKLISSQEDDKPHRRDHQFIWEKSPASPGFPVLQMSCSVHGNSVGSFSLYVQIPESFTAKTDQTDDNRRLLTQIFTLFYVALGIFVGGEFLLSLRQHNFRWKTPLLLAALMFVLSLLSDLNSLPLELAGLDTRESRSHFILSQLLSSLLGGFWNALFILMVAVGADNLQKSVDPARERLVHIFTPAYWKSNHYIKSVIIGYSFGALQLGYVAAFYLVVKKYFGGWSPLESPYYNVASSAIPWIFPLTIGITAALNEELFFRMFSVSLLKRLLRWSPVAVVLPALVWGFLHSNYYVEPIWIRGIELALVGVALGAVYLRFGILPAILCHYTYNSVLGFIPLLRSESLFFKTSGWISLFWIALPALIAVAAYVRLKRRGEAGEFTVPVEEEKPHAEPKETRLHRWGRRLGYEFFGTPAGLKMAARPKFELIPILFSRRAFAVVLLAGIALAAWMYWARPAHYGPPPSGKIGKEKAVSIARNYLNEIGVRNPYEKPLTVFFRETYATTGTFLLRTQGIEQANALMARERLSFLRWGVVFYGLGKPDRFTVSVDADGRVVGFQTARGEESGSGKHLSETEAREKAEAILQRQRFDDHAAFHFIGAKTTKLKSRTDHAFLWEKKWDRLPELSTRVLITVKGDEPGSYEETHSTPEEFVRRLSEKRGLDTTIMLLVAAIVVAGSLWVALDAIFKFRAGALPWKAGFLLGLFFLFFDVIEKSNAWSDILTSLVEANPLKPSVYLLEKIISLTLGQLTSFGFVVFFSAFALALIREKFGDFSVKETLSPRRWGTPAHFQGACLALLAFTAMALGQSFLSSLEARWVPHTVKSAYPFLKESPVHSTLPALGMAAAAFKDAIIFPLTLGALLAMLWKLLRRPIWIFLFVAVTSSLQYFSSQYSWGDIAIAVSMHLVVLGLLALGLARLSRNLLFFYVYFFWIRALSPNLPLIQFSDPFLFWQGAFAAVLILLPLVVSSVLFLFRIDRHPRAS